MSGAWVAFDIPADVAQKIYDPLGQPIDSLHITLGFFDRKLTAKQIVVINQALSVLCEKQVYPLVGTLDGIGYFPQKDGNLIQYIPADIPGVSEFRFRLMNRIQNAVQPNKLHDYSPHVTRAYHVPSPTNVVFNKVSIQLNTVSLHSNGDIYTHTLGSSNEILGPMFISRNLPDGMHSIFDGRKRRRADRNIDNPDSKWTDNGYNNVVPANYFRPTIADQLGHPGGHYG